ncbi:hypothetical protein Fmac_023107 [Flemingia macrophylla]|uniref:GIR1-like zinc ribbon domain-containing protein n=1 Tax=Flemingia macrophylla TaxID=520843 RepID=A0ABD1LKJ6_9FABA
MYLVDSKVGAASEETNKKSLTESGVHENCSGIDLELKLSLPGFSYENAPNALKPPQSVTLMAPSSSRGVYLPPVLRNEENHEPAASTDELTSMTVMACNNCLIYVMVSEFNPKCPNCQNYNLFNIFEVLDPAEKLRTGFN